MNDAQIIEQLPFYCPSLNSVRRVCSEFGDSRIVKQDCKLSLDFLSTDVNMYLVLSHLLSDQTASVQAEGAPIVSTPSSFKEGLRLLESIDADDKFGAWLNDGGAQEYFKTLFLKHELEGFYSDITAREQQRVY